MAVSGLMGMCQEPCVMIVCDTRGEKGAEGGRKNGPYSPFSLFTSITHAYDAPMIRRSSS